MGRERFSSRLGFILISAGCAIGLGNVWRFPYIVGQYGGAAFVLIYAAFLVLLGLPIIVMEYSVGRASQKSAALSFDVLEPKGTKWHFEKWFAMAGNYVLMMFYTTVAGWLLLYVFKMAKGDFVGLDADGVAGEFGSVLANPGLMTVFMLLCVVFCFSICAMGLQNGVEKITKMMMVCLLFLMVVLAINSVRMEGGRPGLEFYLKPDFGKIQEVGVGKVVFAALGQSFFTLSIGIGAMAIFGSYIDKERSLTGEAINVLVLDTLVAFMAGLIKHVQPDDGRTLLGRTVLYLYDLCGGINGHSGIPEYRILCNGSDWLFDQKGSLRQSGGDCGPVASVRAGFQSLEWFHAVRRGQQRVRSRGFHRQQQPASTRKPRLPDVLYQPVWMGI